MPIFWSFRKFKIRSSEIKIVDPRPVLGVREKAIFRDLKFDKRKIDWLGARLLAKDLIRATDERWKYNELGEIEILNQESGAPVVVISGNQGTPGKISMSHSNGVALCAYSPDDIQFGIDLELVEPRAKEFAEDFFTVVELEQVAQQPLEEKNLLVTVIWSGKESVLKALSSGLRVDTRSIEVIFPGIISDPNAWNKLELNSNLVKDNSLSLVWRREGEYVITACIPPGYMEELIRVKV